MPYHAQVIGCRLVLTSVPADEAAEARRCAAWLVDCAKDDDDITLEAIEAELERLRDRAPSVEVHLLVQGEEGARTLYHARAQKLQVWELAKAPRSVEAIIAKLDEESLVEVGKPDVDSRQADLDALARVVEQAVLTRDVPKLLELFDAPELRNRVAGFRDREEIALALVKKPKPPKELAARIKRALLEDGAKIAELIALHFYRHIKDDNWVLGELEKLWSKRPETDIEIARLAKVIENWPDFPFPKGWLEKAPVDLRAILGPQHQDPVVAPKKKRRADLVEAALSALEKGQVDGARRARRTCEGADAPNKELLRKQFHDRLVAIATKKPARKKKNDERLRAVAIDLLNALGRALDAPPALPPFPPFFRQAPSATIPRFPTTNVRGVMRAAPHYPGWLIDENPGITFRRDDKKLIAIDAHIPTGPLRALGSDLDLAFFYTTEMGVFAIDLFARNEVWCCPNVESLGDHYFGRNPPALVCAYKKSVYLLGPNHVFVIDKKTGKRKKVIEIPFSKPSRLVLLDEPEKALVVIDNDEYLLSGLFIYIDDGDRVEDVFVPRVIAQKFAL